MLEPSENTHKTRQGLLSLIMFGILLLAVAAAWLIVRQRGVPVQRAEDMLQDIRHKGLQAYWGAADSRLWYVGKSRTGQPIAWRGFLRTPADDGYRGTAITRTSGAMIVEEWRLSADATTGAYSGSVRPRTFQTTIALRDRQVAVRQIAPNAVQAGQSPAPDNYVPEGMMHLVISRAAEEGGKFTLKTILDEESVFNGRVHFANVLVNAVIRTEVRAQVETDRGVSTLIYRLDSSGQITAMEDPDAGIVFSLVDLPELIRLFPQEGILRRLEAEPMPPETSPAPDAESEGELML